MALSSKERYVSRRGWSEFNVTVNKTVVHYLSFLAAGGAVLNLAVQMILLHRPFQSAVIITLVLAAFCLWCWLLGRLKINAAVKSHLIAATIFIMVPCAVLSFREYAGVTMWAIPLLFVFPAMIFFNRLLLNYLFVSTLLTQICLWLYAPTAAVSIGWMDYVLRFVFVGAAFVLAVTVNRIHVKNQKDNMRHAFYDALTGLPNRALFYERLSQTILRCNQYQHKAALFMMDLDGFKTVNDTLGHAIGDQLLVEVAARLSKCVRKGDSLSRIGGDEFTIVLEELPHTDVVISMAEDVLEALSTPINIGEHTISLGVSIGITSIPEDDSTVEGLVRKTDAAMYLSKSKGKGCYHFHSKEIDANNQRKMQMIPKLKYALMHDQFVLYFQPQVKSNGRGLHMVGLEALIRWEQPEEGIIHPNDFIDCALDTGMIIPIGKWVIHEACRTVKYLQSQGIDIPISVNASVLQFHSDTFIAETTTAIEESGIAPSMLLIEITESIFIDSTGIETLNRLKELGVDIALDDFGTGYSSLGILRSLPIDQLKIDRSFVMNLHKKAEREIAAAIVSMARVLDIDVIAEGVETRQQVDFLSNMGCNLYQGYLFGRPVQLSALMEMFDSKELVI